MTIWLKEILLKIFSAPEIFEVKKENLIEEKDIKKWLMKIAENESQI